MATNPEILAILIMDADGHRLAAKYYGTFLSPKKPQGGLLPETELLRATYEKTLCKKIKHISSRNETEVLATDNTIAVFRSGTDVKVYVIGSSNESELVLSYILEGFFDALTGILHGQTDKRTILDNLEMIMLLIDELCDGGKILEVDASLLMSRVLMREDGSSERDSNGGGGNGGGGAKSLGELTIGQALKQAREQLIVNLGQNGGM